MNLQGVLAGMVLLSAWCCVGAEELPILRGGWANGELRLRVNGGANQPLRIETSSDLRQWEGLFTVLGSGETIDAATPYLPQRFYRPVTPASTNVVMGDHLATLDGELTFHPVNHATFVMTWQDTVIYCDPVGGAARFRGLPSPDLILLSHGHSDHLDANTINAVRGSNTVIVAPRAVYQSLPAAARTVSGILTNGAQTNLLGLAVEAVPAYNLTSSQHAKGVGNGYVLSLGGKRIYISGDTEDTPEMRALENIDVAFVCMNLPFTMSVDKAADAVRAFRPKVVYPYHFSNSDVNRFKRLVGTDLGIEVRLRNWY
jgi:L-ascorbate metabolism protein UlaG (beta-lactamase superfamily)